MKVIALLSLAVLVTIAVDLVTAVKAKKAKTKEEDEINGVANDQSLNDEYPETFADKKRHKKTRS